MPLKLSEQVRLIKNLISLSISCAITFSTQNAILTAQKIITNDNTLSITSQSISFAFSILTAFIIPQLLIKLIGFKWSLVIAELFLPQYVLLSVYSKWYTSVPGLWLELNNCLKFI